MEDPLLSVKKPGRYIGSEFNSVVKSKLEGRVKFAICFPDFYEVGMSNLGLRIIYGLLNKREDCLCERFFLPDMDMLGLIRKGGFKFGSLESGCGMKDFDIAGFSISHELTYTSILHIFDIAGLAFYSKDRDERHPLIIAGGPALSNPEPIADFFDIILIGEAEDALPQLIDEFKAWRNKLSRKELLARLSKIEGIYVPSLFQPQYNKDNSFKCLKPVLDGADIIKHRSVKDLDTSFYPVDWLVPYVQIVQDRIFLELMRGCPHACHFCQARVFYSPLRFRSKERILKLALEAQEKSGYEELSLLGLSSSDHPDIQEIAAGLICRLKDQCVSVSLGSLRPSQKIEKLLQTIAGVKKTGLTLAIESASLRLRKLINKNVDLKALKDLIAFSYKRGYRRIKLYFMFGLPFETQEDLESIPELIHELGAIDGIFRRDLNFTLSLNPFIPKPHTVFQWHAFERIESLEKKQQFLKSAILKKVRNVKVDFRPLQGSLIEALLSRGDRRLSKLIFAAFKNGAILDSYSDYFNFSCWQKAFEACSVDLDYYLHRRIPLEENLPWDIIEMGISKEKLKSDFLEGLNLARAGEEK